MPKRYPSEFRHRVLDLVASGRAVASVAEDIGVSAQTIYNWRRQEAIDRGNGGAPESNSPPPSSNTLTSSTTANDATLP